MNSPVFFLYSLRAWRQDAELNVENLRQQVVNKRLQVQIHIAQTVQSQ